MGDKIMSQFNIIDHNIQIAGFDAEINNLTELMDLIKIISAGNQCEGCVIQLLKSDGIAGEKHVLQAISQALMAFNRNNNMAQDLGLEICVRASAQRQISRALKILGIKEGKMQWRLWGNGNNAITRFDFALPEEFDPRIHSGFDL